MQVDIHTPPPRNALRSAAIVLYAGLALLWFAIPQSVSNWSRDYLPAFVQPIAAPVVGAVESIANETRIPMIYVWVREAFQSATGK